MYDGLEIATELYKDYSSRDMNEADTRHKIIDELIHKVFHWPIKLVDCERYIKPGFADYLLLKNDTPVFLIEAKKEDIYFEVPVSYNTQKVYEYIKIKKLQKHSATKEAIEQARTYCMEMGIEYAAITNGHEWIVFKTFERGKDWADLNAFVIKNLRYFIDEYIHAINHFGYTAISEQNSLKKLLDKSSEQRRNIFYPKDKINAFDEKIHFNQLYNRLDPIMKKFFGTFKENDKFLEHCYIHDREYEAVFDGVREILKDSLTPYFAHFRVTDFVDSSDGGAFGTRIGSSSKKMDADVVVLFGGKGVGKSTFLKKLLFYTPPAFLAENSVICYIDLLNVSEDREAVLNEIWAQMLQQLDVDEILKSNRDVLLKKLFNDKFSIALKQDLFGFSPDSADYNRELNQLVKNWKSDVQYCAQRLAEYHHANNKGIIIVIDNTDQFSTEIQDMSFTVAHELSKKLSCLTIISMREERFYKSTIHGTLDAYTSSGFHISSPLPQEVFIKRIEYVLEVINREPTQVFNDIITEEEKSNLIKVLNVFKSEFKRESPLNNFLTACAHGDIRLALKLFRAFSGSGYTNINEIVNADSVWKLKIHQVIKPFMVPDRYFYDESQSSIPNVFQLRSQTNASHFTSLRILEKISYNLDSNKTNYFSVAELKDYFIEQFDMKNDFENNLDMLLKYRLVEADNRIDFFTPEVDSIKVTTYGNYVLKELSSYFAYLELICTDCGVFRERFANELYIAANKEYRYYKEYDRKNRLEARLEKVKFFIEYLLEEEKYEAEKYNFILDERTSFSQKIHNYFEKEKGFVLESASRNLDKKTKPALNPRSLNKLNRHGFRVLN